MSDQECIDYLESICQAFVHGSKQCEGAAQDLQQTYISAIRHAMSIVALHDAQAS